MYMKKFEFTGETKILFNGTILHRIKALVEIKLGCFIVKAGDLGGWIEKEENLSQDGNAWVYCNAMVYGNARVYCNAIVYGNAWVYGNAMVGGDAEVYGNAWVYGNAMVHGNAMVGGDAEVYGNAWIYGNAMVGGDAEVYCNAIVYGNARVHGNARVGGDAEVYGNAWVYGNAMVHGDSYVYKPEHILVIGPIGSRNGYTTFTRNKAGEIKVKCGYFFGDTPEFLDEVEKTHGDSKYGNVYRLAVQVALEQIDTEPMD